MVKLRLQRRGRKKLPVYKIVAADSRSPRNGRFIEILGQYRPLEHPAGVKLDEERVLHWLTVGAQPSDTVRSLLSREGVMLRFHLMRKGKSEDEINQTMTAWAAAREARRVRSLSKKQLRAQKKQETEAAAEDSKTESSPEPSQPAE